MIQHSVGHFKPREYFGIAAGTMFSSALKNGAYHIVGRMVHASPWTRSFFGPRPSIIFYHGVWERGTARRELFDGLSVDHFRADLSTLHRSFDFVRLDDIMESLPETNGRPRLHVSFDDGLDLIGSGAAEILEEFGVSATVFVNTASVIGGHLMWQHCIKAIRGLRGDAVFLSALNDLQERLGMPGRAATGEEQIRLTRLWPADCKDEYTAILWESCAMPPLDAFLEEHRPYMGWEALRSWLARGHTVGFHTHSHPFCSQLNDEQLDAELFAPTRMLKEQLGLTSVPFAYPFGDRPSIEQEARIARAGTFSCLLGTSGFSAPGTQPMQLNRVAAEPDVYAQIFGRPICQWLLSQPT